MENSHWLKINGLSKPVIAFKLGYYIFKNFLIQTFELFVWEPYNKIKTWFFALKLRKFGSTFSGFSKSSNHFLGTVNMSTEEEVASDFNFSSAYTNKITKNLLSKTSANLLENVYREFEKWFWNITGKLMFLWWKICDFNVNLYLERFLYV